MMYPSNNYADLYVNFMVDFLSIPVPFPSHSLCPYTHVPGLLYILQLCIRESVDSLCRDGADTGP